MSIPSQLPQLVAAARSGALQALALQAGQVLDGKVIGPAPKGGTQVQISGQMLNLVLPTLVKAGETLKFEVLGSGTQLKLALQPAVQSQPTIAAPSASPPPVPAQPNTLPLPGGQPAIAPPPAQAVSPQASAPTVAAPTSPQTTIATPASPALVQITAAPQTSSGLPTPPPGSPPSSIVASVVALPAQNQTAPPVPSGPGLAPAAQPATQPTTSPATLLVTPPIAAPLPQQQPYPPAVPRNTVPAAPVPVAATTPVAAGATPLPPSPSAAPASGPVPQQAAAPLPLTPQAAVAQMVQAALPRQDSITSLTVALTSIAGKVALPEPVIRAAQQVLAGRVAIDGGKLDAAGLQKAIMRSGVFQEANLARAASPLLAPQGDTKSALLALRQTLTTWLGQQAPLTPAGQIAPPIRGHVPRARASEAPPIDPRAAPEEVGKRLLERTEAAISRVRLHQSASLPDTVAKTADWSMDLPVLIGQHQTVLQLQIHRDEHNGSEAAAERGWQMRFAINLPGMGEVGAQVSLRAGTTGVMLWAAERGTSEALEADAAALRDTLTALGLNPGAVLVRHGEPPAPPPAPSGHYVDAST